MPDQFGCYLFITDPRRYLVILSPGFLFIYWHLSCFPPIQLESTKKGVWCVVSCVHLFISVGFAVIIYFVVSCVLFFFQIPFRRGSDHAFEFEPNGLLCCPLQSGSLETLDANSRKKFDTLPVTHSSNHVRKRETVDYYFFVVCIMPSCVPETVHFDVRISKSIDRRGEFQ